MRIGRSGNRHEIYIHITIYIYRCVCVCVYCESATKLHPIICKIQTAAFQYAIRTHTRTHHNGKCFSICNWHGRETLSMRVAQRRVWCFCKTKFWIKCNCIYPRVKRGWKSILGLRSTALVGTAVTVVARCGAMVIHWKTRTDTHTHKHEELTRGEPVK